MSTPIDLADLQNHLPERIWYLSGDGSDIYCRRPYSFLFSTGAAASEFAQAFDIEELQAIGIDRHELNMQDLMTAFSAMQVTRLFIDPTIDPDTGDVFGTILRFQEPN
jgi:hypothetical protein